MSILLHPMHNRSQPPTEQSTTDLPDRVRAACARVAARAAHVRIQHTRIPGYAAELPAGVDVLGPDLDIHYAGGPREAVSAFVLCLDAINFGSGWWPTIRKSPGRSGYMTMAGALTDRFASRGPWPAPVLAEIDAGQIAEVLGQDPGHELMPLFAAALRDLGAHVRDEAGGRYERVVDDARGSAVALVTRLSGWDCFADVSSYAELEVPFFKRAQLTASDLQLAGVAEFGDLRRLTAFADNLVPHVLALDGVLVLEPDLAARIAAGTLLVHGSPEEVELRACAVHAVELLAAACGHRLSPAQIDLVLWTRGQQPRVKAHPRPRARCIAY